MQLEADLTASDLTPEAIFEHRANGFAPFRVPRHLEYVEAFAMTVSDDKVAKAQLVEGVDDPIADAFDRVGS